MSQTSRQLDSEHLYFVPLGGSEQFGVNLNVYAYGGKLLAVDCGIGFADERFPGIDLLLPDPAFLEEQSDDLAGLIITHAHEDHIGAVAYLWERLNCPIYASAFTVEILQKKFEETGLKNVPINVVEPMGEIKVGPFGVQFIPVSHSVPGTCSLLIDTPEGRILHSGDWNLDPKPVVDNPTDPKPFQEAGARGVLAYIGDSTNAEIPGRAGSESDVEIGLEAEFKKCNGRIAVTIFSSNIGRIISIARAAEKCGRSVAVIGRSLHRMIGAAHTCGYMNDLQEFVSEDDIDLIPRENLVIILTGSQGEYRAALPRVARGEHNALKLQEGDAVIFSARAIPGNERNINEVKNNLVAGKVHVITPRDTENIIHVSGHPYQGEIADMLSWVKPEIVIPVHGERTQLEAQAKFARSCQIKNTIVPNNGSLIKLAPGKPEIVDHVQTGVLAVDQKRIIKSDHQSITARRKLQYTGTAHMTIVLDGRGEIIGAPRLDTIGLIEEGGGEEQIEARLIDNITGMIEDMSWEQRMDDGLIEEEVRIHIRRFCDHVLGFKPKATVHLVRV